MIMATFRIINTHFSSSEKKKDKNSISLASGYHGSDVRGREREKKAEQHHDGLGQG